MAIENSKLRKAQLNNILSNRKYLIGYHQDDENIFGKIIDDSIILTQPISNNSNTGIRNLIFQECTFNSEIFLGDFVSAGYITFKTCIFNGPVKFCLSNTKYSRDCKFNNDLTLETTDRDKIKISNLNINGELKVIGHPVELTLENINNDLKILDQSITLTPSLKKLSVISTQGKSIKFSENSDFLGEIVLKKVQVQDFQINHIKLHTEIKIEECTISTLNINNIEGETRQLALSNSNILNLFIKLSNLNKTIITECIIENLRLSDINQINNIMAIEKSSITNLLLDKVYNDGLISLKEIKIVSEGLVSIKSTNLGKADFIYCDFSKASLEFENSKITEAFFSETEFPKKVLVNGVKNFAQAQLTFGQLATAFQKQGDTIRAFEYNSRELESHYQNIKWLSSNFSTKLNLFLNSISNNFGRSWVRGVYFSFGIGFIFFCLLLISTNNYNWGFPSLDLDMIPAYLKFMNPLRFYELDALFKDTQKEGNILLNGQSYLADFAGRIFVGYGYYQTIQAFRRFGRK